MHTFSEVALRYILLHILQELKHSNGEVTG